MEHVIDIRGRPMHESKLDRAASNVVGVIDQRIAIDLFGLCASEVCAIRGDGGPFRCRVVPLVELDGMFVFTVVVAVEMETDRRRGNGLIATKLEPIVEARCAATFLNDELDIIG
jgi:hypothetical protein